MALNKKKKSKLGSYTWEHDGHSLVLRSTLENLKSLELDVGKNLFAYLDDCSSPANVAKLFFHMQVPEDGDEVETESDIYEYLFADLKNFAEPSTQEKLADCILVLMGVDKAEALMAAEAAQKKAESSEQDQPAA